MESQQFFPQTSKVQRCFSAVLPQFFPHVLPRGLETKPTSPEIWGSSFVSEAEDLNFWGFSVKISREILWNLKKQNPEIPREFVNYNVSQNEWSWKTVMFNENMNLIFMVHARNMQVNATLRKKSILEVSLMGSIWKLLGCWTLWKADWPQWAQQLFEPFACPKFFISVSAISQVPSLHSMCISLKKKRQLKGVQCPTAWPFPAVFWQGGPTASSAVQGGSHSGDTVDGSFEIRCGGKGSWNLPLLTEVLYIIPGGWPLGISERTIHVVWFTTGPWCDTSESCFRCNSNCNCWTLQSFGRQGGTQHIPAISLYTSCLFAVSSSFPLARISNTFHGHVNCWCVAGQSKLKTKTMTQHQCKASKTWWIGESSQRWRGQMAVNFLLTTLKDGENRVVSDLLPVVRCNVNASAWRPWAMNSRTSRRHRSGVWTPRKGWQPTTSCCAMKMPQKLRKILKNGDCQDTSLLRPGFCLHICAPVAQSVQPCFLFLWPTFSPRVFHSQLGMM